MARLVPQTFPIPVETAIASYSYTDIAEGTGVINFLGFSSIDDTTVDYHLTSNASVYSNSKVLSTSTTTGGSSKDIDNDYDITFNLPQRMKGTIYTNISTFVTSNVGGATSYFFIIKIRKWDGSSETEIASGQSITFTNVGSASAKEWITQLIPIPVTTLQHFKKGDTLRITVEGWSNRSSGAGNFGYGQDPAGRLDELEDTTKFQNFVPFILDI